MDSPGHVATRLAATPSKASGEATTGAAAVSTPNPGSAGAPAVEMVDISSPDPASFSFARQKKHPPALSTKPKSARKVASLFSSDGAACSGGSSAGKGLGDGSSKLISSAPAAPAALAAAPGGSICSNWQDDPDDDDTTESRGEDGAQTWDSQVGDSGGSGSGDSTGAGFTSPVRKWRPGTASSRFTPQRNLVGLFASPLPLPPPTLPLLSPPNNREDAAATSTRPAPATAGDPTEAPGSTNLMAAPPLLLLSPKPEEIVAADEAASNRPEAKAAPARAAVTAEAAATVAAAAVKLPMLPAAGAEAVAGAIPPAPAAAARSAAMSAAREDTKPECRCGCSSSGATGTDCDDVCCVSNEAFKDGKTMRTLEVLVKRERVGVSALASWRVAELKRRLVHMKLFPAAEVITLVPTFPLGGGAALEDDVTLDTLDIDVTYKARRAAVAAAT